MVFYGSRRGRRTFFNGFRRWFCMVSVVAENVCFIVFPSLVFNGFRLLQDRGCVSDGNRFKKTPGRFRDELSMYTYMYVYIYNMYIMCIYIYIYTHIHLSLSLSIYIYIYICSHIHIHTYMQ